MLSRIIGNHPQVLWLRELHFFGDLCPIEGIEQLLPRAVLENLAATIFSRQAREVWGEGPTPEERERAQATIASLGENELNGAGVFRGVLEGLASAAQKTLACEQTPRNIFYADKLLQLYPDGRMIHIVRDPRAVLASQKNRWRLRKLGAKHLPMIETLRTWVNYHPVTMTQLWSKATDKSLQMRGHPRFMLLKFEDVIADPEQEVRRICQFLKLDYQPDLLDIPQWASSNQPATARERGVSRRMKSHWRRVLTPGEVAICERLTKDRVQSLGYPVETDHRGSAASILVQALRYPLHLMGVVLVNPRRAWIQLRALLTARSV